MKGSRTKVSLGAAILILVGGMLTDPPDAILYSLGAVGVFILIWGMRPDWISWLVSRLPWRSRLVRGLENADRWIDWAGGAPHAGPGVIAELKATYRRGDGIRRTFNRSTAAAWEGEAQKYIEEHVAEEAFSFENCHGDNVGPARLAKKLEKVRAIIQRLEWRV